MGGVGGRGQFTEGLSKQYIRQNPKTGFLVMTLDKDLWRGKATWTHCATAGEDYDAYNSTPMFRYNAYFGIHTVYYMDLVSQTGKTPLPMGQIIPAALKTMLAKAFWKKDTPTPALNAWTQALMNKLDNLKFLAYVDEDGYPVIIPVIQAAAPDSTHILFSTAAYGDEVKAIPAGTPLAVFGMTLKMEDVLMRGTFTGLQHMAGVQCGSIEVDWVYNSMPPTPGQIYPPIALEPIRDFS